MCCVCVCVCVCVSESAPEHALNTSAGTTTRVSATSGRRRASARRTRAGCTATAGRAAPSASPRNRVSSTQNLGHVRTHSEPRDK